MENVESPTEQQPNLNELANDMFEKIGDYLNTELAGTQDDYRLLEEINRVTITKYSDMKQISSNVSKALKELNDKYDNLKPCLDQIDQIHDSVTKLEQVAYKLDAYSKRLENQFKQYEKR